MDDQSFLDNLNMEKVYFSAPRFDNIKEILIYSKIKYKDKSAFAIKTKNNELKKRYNNNLKDELGGDTDKYLAVSFNELYRDARALAQYLLDKGLENEKIALMSKNRYEWNIGYFANMLLGSVIVPLDKSLTESEILNSIEISKPKMFIYEEHLDNVTNIMEKEETKDIEFITMEYGEDKKSSNRSIFDLVDEGLKSLERFEKEKNDEKASSDEKDTNSNAKHIDDIDIYKKSKDMGLLLFTSGTTSSSKAVVLTQNNIATNITDIMLVEDFRPEYNNLAFLPYHHLLGSTGQLLMLATGIRTAYADGIRHIGKNIVEYNCSIFVGVPSLVDGILKKARKAIKEQGKEKLVNTMIKISNFLLKFKIDIRRILFKQIIEKMGGLKLIVSAASAINPSIIQGISDFGVEVIQGYGLTETSPVLTMETPKDKKLGSVGKPAKSVQLRIDDPNSEGIGEILAKGANVTSGYYNNIEATKEMFNKDGWFKTGDLGYLDDDGFLFITGRIKNVIVLKNGKNIYPEELEELVNEIPYVEESMVFGYPEDGDETISVKIQYNKEDFEKDYINNGKDFEDFKKDMWNKVKEINKTVATYKYIKHMILTDEDFIKTSTRKIKRFKEIEKIVNEGHLDK